MPLTRAHYIQTIKRAFGDGRAFNIDELQSELIKDHGDVAEYNTYARGARNAIICMLFPLTKGDAPFLAHKRGSVEYSLTSPVSKPSRSRKRVAPAVAEVTEVTPPPTEETPVVVEVAGAKIDPSSSVWEEAFDKETAEGREQIINDILKGLKDKVTAYETSRLRRKMKVLSAMSEAVE